MLNNRLSNVTMEEKHYPFSMYPGVSHECYLEFPKGVLEKGEEPIAAAIREFREETAVELVSGLKPEISIKQSYRSNNGILYENHYYLFNNKIFDTSASKIVKTVGFDIVVWTRWETVRRYFINMKFWNLVSEMDEYLGINTAAVRHQGYCYAEHNHEQ